MINVILLLHIITMIVPFSSQKIIVSLNETSFPSTLDSGATVSYLTSGLVETLNVAVQPNNQLAALADGNTKKRSLGEIITLKMDMEAS